MEPEIIRAERRPAVQFHRPLYTTLVLGDLALPAQPQRWQLEDRDADRALEPLHGLLVPLQEQQARGVRRHPDRPELPRGNHAPRQPLARRTVPYLKHV